MPDLSIVIVSYKTIDVIGDCLSSVFATQGISIEVFVVDNASGDGSADFVRVKFPLVRVIANEENRGFGAANNQVLRDCTGRYVVLLNPDTTVEPDTFSRMIAYMDCHPEVGLAGPGILNTDGTPQHSVSTRYPGHRHGARDLGNLPGVIACVMGACQIIRTDLIKSIGGFDEDFFLYAEDQDICLRVRKQGSEIGYIDDVVIIHHGGMSERDNLPAEIVRKKVKAEILFCQKHYRPETLRSIRRQQRVRALWRIFSIKLLLSVASDKDSLLLKLAKYRVVWDEMSPPALN
ncbi:MAG: glycosyltransferase family 2 protein [Syntrophobacteraceae bacterium]